MAEKNPSANKGKTSYVYKLFRVKRSDGRVTTVSVNPVLAIRASMVMGNPSEVGKFVRAAAMEYRDDSPEAKSCSGFVSTRLTKELVQRGLPM